MPEQEILTEENEIACIGIDIGGTNTRVGLFHDLTHPEYRPLARFPTSQSYEEQMRRMITAIGSIQIGQEADIKGIGVSIAGRIARDGRSVIVAPNLPEYVGKPFAFDLSRQFHCPVRLAHDAVCGLLTEKKYGPLQHYDRCAYLTVSTGTGAAIQLSSGSE